MMQELCGGAISDATHAGAVPDWQRTIAFDPGHVQRLGGLTVPQEDQRRILEALGFQVSPDWQVAPPSWRRDIEGPADLVEEVVRVFGIDRVAPVPLPRDEGVARPTATPRQRLERRVRRALAAAGLDEAVTWSFIAEAEAARFGGAAHRLQNPLSAELAVMRPSLVPGLATAAARNLARGAPASALFEIGRRYLADGERPTAGLLLAGIAQPRHWQTGKARAFAALDARAEVLAALAAAGAPVERLATAMPAAAHYHPGRSARLLLGKAVLAEFGELHPSIAAALDLPAGTAAAEIFLDALPDRPKKPRGPYDPPALMPLTRDFAFLVAADLPAEKLLRAIEGADRALIAEVSLFDRFAGPGVPEGEVSLAVSTRLQPRDRTPTEADLDALTRAVEAAAAKVGGRLRG
jgi:phenylalanyl-tRNA synthetase beta chain